MAESIQMIADSYLTQEKMKKLGLPDRYAEKLQYDLEQIRETNLPGLRAIVLFGSCARRKARVGRHL